MSEEEETPTPVANELEPFKIVGQLIGIRRNADGEITGEEVMGEVAIYRPNFGRVEQLVDEAVAASRAQLKA
jgi:hypothetical protein